MMEIGPNVWRTSRGTAHAGAGNRPGERITQRDPLKIRITDQTSRRRVVAVTVERGWKSMVFVVGSQHRVVVKSVTPSGTIVMLEADHSFFGRIPPHRGKKFANGAKLDVVFTGPSHRSRSLLFKPVA